jgi:CHAT domain-containing protein
MKYFLPFFLLLPFFSNAQDTIPATTAISDNTLSSNNNPPDSLGLDTFSYSLDADNYIIDSTGQKIYGQIKNSTKISAARHIYFKNEEREERLYYPTEISEWKKDGKINRSKQFQVNKEKTITTFMELLSSDSGAVKVYEFHNSFIGAIPIALFLLEKDGVLTEVKNGKFKKEMQAYFADQPEIVAYLEENKLKRKDLVSIVAKYNDLVKEEEAKPLKKKEVEKKVVKTTKPAVLGEIVWDIDDLLLSPEDLIKKYLLLLEQELKHIRDQDLKQLIINHRLGTVFFDQTQYDIALPYLKSAKKLLDKYPPSSSKLAQKVVDHAVKHDLSFQVEYMLGAIYLSKKRYHWSISYNTKALAIGHQGLSNAENESFMYEAYVNQGKLLKVLPQSAQNMKWYKKGAAEENKNWSDAIKEKGLTKVINVLRKKKSTDYNLALINFDNAYAISKKTLPQIDLPLEVQLEIGMLYFEAGDYSQSKIYYEEALRLIDKVEEHPKEVTVRRLLSEICLAERLHKEALEYIEQAQNLSLGARGEINEALLNDITKIPFPFELLSTIVAKGMIRYEVNSAHFSEEELKKVLVHYDIAAKLLCKLRSTHRNENSKTQLASITHKFSQHAILVCNTLYDLTQEEDYLKQAFYFVELSKSAILYESIQGLNYQRISGVPKEIIVQENGLKVQIGYLKSQLFYELGKGATKNSSRIEALESQLTKVTRKYQTHLKEIQRTQPKYHALKYNYDLASMENIQAKLAPNEVFLQYAITDSFVFVLAIHKDSIQKQMSFSDKSIVENIKQLHLALKTKEANLYQDEVNRLHPMLLSGFSDFIKEKKLIISPDAELNYIPFGALPKTPLEKQYGASKLYQSIRYLIEDHSICYTYSATLFLKNLEIKPSKTLETIGIWSPNFKNMDSILVKKGFGQVLTELPGAEEEANLIAKMFGKLPFLGKEASEVRFKEIAGEYAVLHLATHGILQDREPLFSGLILNDRGEEDGILHTFELYNMDLNANLAVLSACNSGIGQVERGAGVLSIARGFTYAGVPNIVMSNWSVSDWSTAQLMESFYAYLKEGLAKDEALQKAKIDYIDAQRASSSALAPFYWGGFVLLGNTDPVEQLISSNTGFSYLILVGIGLLLLLFAGFWYFKRKNTEKEA